jgi:hypothetical protein
MVVQKNVNFCILYLVSDGKEISLVPRNTTSSYAFWKFGTRSQCPFVVRAENYQFTFTILY